eukprot:g26346.t1
MMTGQILGGAPPMKAARYQIVITFLISGCSFAALCLICAFTIQAFFDERGRHDDSEVKPQSRLNISKLLDFSKWPSRKTQAVPATSTPLLADSASPLALQKTWDKSKDGGGLILDLPLEGLVGKQRPLKVHFKVHDGEVLCMMGPSVDRGPFGLCLGLQDPAWTGDLFAATLAKGGPLFAPDQSATAWYSKVVCPGGLEALGECTAQRLAPPAIASIHRFRREPSGAALVRALWRRKPADDVRHRHGHRASLFGLGRANQRAG